MRHWEALAKKTMETRRKFLATQKKKRIAGSRRGNVHPRGLATLASELGSAGLAAHSLRKCWLVEQVQVATYERSPAHLGDPLPSGLPGLQTEGRVAYRCNGSSQWLSLQAADRPACAGKGLNTSRTAGARAKIIMTSMDGSTLLRYFSSCRAGTRATANPGHVNGCQHAPN